MTRVNSDLGNPGYGAIGIWVEAYETANNGTSSTVHVRGGYYNNSPYNIYASTAYVSLNGRGNVSFTTGYPGDHVTDEFDVEVAHNGDGSAVSASYSCYGHSTYPANDVNPSVTIATSGNPTYAVAYNGNGGTTPGGQTKVYGINLGLNGSSSRDGYTFQYWSGSDGSTYYPGSVFTGNYALTLTAVWSINTWQVSFNANGGTNAPGNQTKTYGQTLTITTSVPTRTLYDFVSWSGSDGATYYPGGSFTGNYALSLTANWKLAYVAPTITSLAAYHCTSDGTAADDGTYIKVTIGWKVDTSIYSDNQGSGILVKCDNVTIGTITISGTSGTATLVFGGSYNGDNTSTVSVYLYDTKQPGLGVSNSVLAQGATYLMDFSPDGNVCFGGAADLTYQICTKKNGTITWHP